MKRIMKRIVEKIVKKAAVLAALTAAGVFAVPHSPARAQEAKDDAAFQQHLFGHVLQGKQMHGCFSRVYDAGHLGQHPRQNVRTMLLLVRAKADDDNQTSYAVRLGVTFRKSGAHFESAGDCSSIHDTTDAGGSAGVAHCGVDCDGGSIDVAIKDAKSVLVSIPEGARIWRAKADNDSDQRRRFGSDDKVFRVDKVALTECLGLADDSKERASMRHGQ
jgi:hypothetical protein